MIRNQILKIPQNVESGVIEGGHRVEDADSGCAKGWIVLDEYKETEDGSGQLENQRHEENALDKTNQALPGVQIHGLPDEISTLHVYLLPIARMTPAPTAVTPRPPI